MIEASSPGALVRLHLTNVNGAGASQLLLSLLPALESDLDVVIESIDLPDRGILSTYTSANNAVVEVYRRHLPNALSRLLECTLRAKQFDGDSPLFVLGDLPLRCRGPQVVFVQQSNLVRSFRFNWRLSEIIYILARAIFRINRGRVKAFIVQTDVMRVALERCYPDLTGRVHVIAQPVPLWLLKSGLSRKARVDSAAKRLRLIYPAADYPHKNHALLSRFDMQSNCPVEQLIVTLSSESHPAPHLAWVECTGFLSPQDMIEAYSQVDGLVFLSREESYGFPLVEAMYVGLPIICPDLAYAHVLCGDEAIYFDPDDSESLLAAFLDLQSRLDKGWWPDWEDRLVNIPQNWESVASRMLDVVRGSDTRSV